MNRKTWARVGGLGAIVLSTGGLLFIHGQDQVAARDWGHEVVLTHVDLTKAVLRGASLARVNLQGAILDAADLRGADLRNAKLRDASLVGTDLRDADLTGADLRNATIKSYVFIYSGPRRGTKSCLGWGPLPKGGRWILEDKPTDFRGANLRGADLRGADMGFIMSNGQGSRWCPDVPDLTGATYDAQTRWPKGFHPTKMGAVLVK